MPRCLVSRSNGGINLKHAMRRGCVRLSIGNVSDYGAINFP